MLGINKLKLGKKRLYRRIINYNFYQYNKIIDNFLIYLYSIFFSIKYSLFGTPRLLLRVKSTKLNYFNFNFFNFNYYFYGLVSIWNSLVYWTLTLLVTILVFYYLIFIHIVSFNKIVFLWFCIIMFFYWLISGFVFFFKKYQFSKFTSAIQRFWRRSFIIFWGIESILFLFFIFYVLNASQEPSYMYDFVQLNKTHLFSWKLFLNKLIPTAFLIIFSYILLFSLKWNTHTKHMWILVVNTIILTYVVWVEFYQFFFTITWYGDLSWIFDFNERLWNLETSFKRTRLLNNYVTICIIAKFWHLIFIYIFWVFFVLRITEASRIRYPLLSANMQNFVILYIMNFLLMYPWVKFIVRRYYSSIYYWFFASPRKLFVRGFFYDARLYFYGLVNFLDNCFPIINFFKNYKFFYWNESSAFIGFNQYKRYFIRDLFLRIINYY